MARKCKRERETKRAGGKVQQQEPRARSHYDSSSSWTSPGVDCKPQSPRPDRETGESVEDRCESGCTQRGGLQQRGPAQEAKNMTSPFFTIYACSTNRCGCISYDKDTSKKPRSQVWLSWTIVLVHFCNEMNHHIRSYLQIPPSIRSIQLLSNECKNEPQLGRSSALNLNSYFNLSAPAVLSVPAEKEASTYCQHK